MELSNLSDYVLGKLSGLFLPAGSTFSLLSLGTALVVAAAFVAGQRLRRGRPVRLRVLARALARTHRPRPTLVADLGYFLFNLFLAGIFLGGALLSFAAVSGGTSAALVSAFGERAAPAWPEWVSRVLITTLVFVAYELGYWFDHWLSHKVPVLWEFHRVHHSAEVLTPWTVWRIHPVDSLKFANILALATGSANGLGLYLFGSGIDVFSVSGTNVILVAFVYAVVHLQHSHVWIPFRGWLGCLFQSPAHHQIHHSSNPIHFNKNLGSCLAVWDWLFGTLHIPATKPENLRFGVTAGRPEVHSVTELLVNPFVRAGRHAVRFWRRRIVTVPRRW